MEPIKGSVDEAAQPAAKPALVDSYLAVAGEASSLLFPPPAPLNLLEEDITDREESEEDIKMADPFEVRMRFTSQLQHLNASVSSAQKAAQYALKYKEMDEDLHSCILEQLERSNMNIRANIMYFIEHFLEMAQKDGHEDYVCMMQRDIIRIVDAVAPDDGSGAANVKVVRKVLEGLQHKKMLEPQTVADIEECLKDRDTTADDVAMGSPATGEVDVGMAPSQTIPKVGKTGSQQRLDKRQVEQRIEEDRERHKRLRENIWAIPPGDKTEKDRIWDETSDYGEDDDLFGAEEWDNYQAAWDEACPHGKSVSSNGKDIKAGPSSKSNGH